MKVTRKDEYLIITIEQKQANQTVREFLQHYHLSRKKIHELYMNKRVKLNKEIANFNAVLQIGDKLAIPVFEKEVIDFKPQKMKLDIIYEDDHLLIINKPAGLMVHPDQKEGMNTLVNGVAYYYQEHQIHHRIRYIHRLDTDTSGGIIFAKHYLAHSLMDHWLAEKKIKRWYLGLVNGRLSTKKERFMRRLEKDRHHSARRRVAKNGDTALTYYQLKQQFKTYALVELELKTGRTHQIRVHMSHLGHPLLGDHLYGGPAKVGPLRRQALHSSRIEMIHPITEAPLKFEVPLPLDMKKLI